MASKIFRKKDGTYTLKEYENNTQNSSVIPLKVNFNKKISDLRAKARIKSK